MSRKLNVSTVIGIVLMCCAVTFFVTYLSYEQIWPKLSGYNASIVDYQAELDKYSLALEGNEKYVDGMAKYTELRKKIDEYYVNDYNEQELNDTMAAGVVAGTGDKWAYYVSAENYDDYVLSGQNEYYGIGITIQADEASGGYEIVRVAEDGPANNAGIKVNDILMSVDGTSVEGLAVDEVKSMVQGDTGTSVTIGITRDGVPMEVTAVRGTASYEIAISRMLDDNVGYIRLTNFEGGSADAFLKACDQLVQQGATSFVFDVRNNPGGLMQQLLTILDALLPEGEIFVQEDYLGNKTVYQSNESCIDYPITVLVNENSYSAAEYFAAILQEDDRAEIVGVNTTGKGNYQAPIQLSDGSAAVISIGKYMTPGGQFLADTGVTPDYIVEMDDETNAKLYYGVLDDADDEQLKQAQQLSALAAN